VQRQRELDALRQELEAARIRGQALQNDADRVPGLLSQLEESQTDHRLHIERAPYGICQCTSDGAITNANPSLVRLLGYRTENELRKVEFGKVFESAADLRWLIERSLSSTGTNDWMEATWRKKDRSRLVVRLQLQAVTDSSVQMIVEDVTRLRNVEDKLRQAQRMEAVARLASEVAATCDSLLHDASVNGQRWLAEIGGDTPLRQQGELVLGEVTRAASYLRQLTVYGNKQVSALEPVSVQRVLRDLEPVLKRVAGDDIELVLPKPSASVDADADVDVEAERVERVLVNVASYARERMPHGGRVNIDLATTIVDRKFVARYPNVRPGAHLVITVTEVRGTDRPGLPADPMADPAEADAKRSETVKPGVDLGALLRLIGECGGHLWMAAEPSGDMTLKIHLPKRTQDTGVDASAPIPRPDRRGKFAGWFRH
jgi:two-component system, cell cycle sensor histidine kinase and response regulator CckA